MSIGDAQNVENGHLGSNKLKCIESWYLSELRPKTTLQFKCKKRNYNIILRTYVLKNTLLEWFVTTPSFVDNNDNDINLWLSGD